MEPNTNNQTWMSRLKEQLFGKKNEPQTTTQTEVKPPLQDADAGKRTAKTVPDIPSPFDNLGLSEGDGNLVPATLKKHFNDLSAQFEKLGKEKGRLGHDDLQTIAELAKSEATIFHERVKAEVGGKVDVLRVNMECDKTNKDIMESNYGYQKDNHDALENERMLNPNSFSWLLAAVYFISGLALLLADCVLALNLMSIAFDFESPPEKAYQLISLGTEATLPILKHNWEVLVTSLGIAFLSIYVKIFYDEYISTVDGNRLIRLNRVFTLIGKKEDSKDGDALMKEMRIKFRVRLAILICTFGLLGLLARLRYLAEITADTNAGNSGVFSQHDETGWTILMLTLLFPIIAGICFSLAFKVWQNNRSYVRAKTGLKNSKINFEDAIKKHLLSQKQFQSAEKILTKWINETEFLENAIDYLLLSYKNGYWIDYVNPDVNDGITDIVERMAAFRNKTTARRHYSQLYKTS